ncbi:hypothetical protein [Chromobacterium amazonense]|uniref:hypothetical protein n=1 Tax=Chromobacterium amazonense TaxID=1382803 RepID=UPI003F78C6D2
MAGFVFSTIPRANVGFDHVGTSDPAKGRMGMKKSLVYALSAGGAMLGAGAAAQAEPLQMAMEPMLSSYGSALLTKKSRDGAAEFERLSQLRGLVHNSSIHCSNPGCPLCNPQGQLPKAL